eukprot:4620117-Prymnesium_polylepis.1
MSIAPVRDRVFGVPRGRARRRPPDARRRRGDAPDTTTRKLIITVHRHRLTLVFNSARTIKQHGPHVPEVGASPAQAPRRPAAPATTRLNPTGIVV